MEQFQKSPELIGPRVGQVTRRGFLLASGLIALTGCGPERATSSLPGVPWPAHEPLPPLDPAPSGPSTTPSTNASIFPGVKSRSQWAKGEPVLSLMNSMTPVRHITVHHDGMSVFTGSSTEAAIERLDLIRRAHRGKSWGDIGYHFIVDRSGQVWEGRGLKWQGAHVKDHNEGNIGVMALGNFDSQTPPEAQVEGLRRHIAALMRHFDVPASRVKTHQEWSPTACPGRSMQPKIVSMRTRSFA